MPQLPNAKNLKCETILQIKKTTISRSNNLIVKLHPIVSRDKKKSLNNMHIGH